MTVSEEKYWMENYPKEAETIITLSKVFDELGNDDASKAQLNYVIGLLRRKEEGRLIELPTIRSSGICTYCKANDNCASKTYGRKGCALFVGKKVIEVSDEN